MTKKKSTDAVENTEATEKVSDLDTVETTKPPETGEANGTKNVVEVKPYKKYIYLGASLPNNALKSNTVFDGTFEEICTYLQTEITAYPLIKELLIPVERLAVSGSSARISSLKKALLKSFERGH